MASTRRDPAGRRQAGQLCLDLQPRLLGAASPPEADRGSTRTLAARRSRSSHGRSGGEGGQGRRLLRRRHRRVHLPGRRLLLPRDEHPTAGRALRQRDDHRHRPRRVADPRRCGRRAPDDPGAGRRIASRSLDRDPDQRRGSRRRKVPPRTRPDHEAGSSGRFRRALGHRVPVGRRDQPVLRQPRRQAHRLGSNTRRRHRSRHSGPR